MSASMCCAESLNPMGIPPVTSRTSAATPRKSSVVTRSGKVGGLIAACPGSSPRTSAILPTTFPPGRCPPVPVFAP